MRIGIVGLGTAGSAAAALCSARGLEVIGLEAGALGAAGARWVNGVPRWAFEEAGLDVPVGAELRGAEGPFHLVGAWGPEKVTATSVLEVDMRHLVARLQAQARRSGADLREEVRVARVDRGVAETSAGPIAADVWIDAAGLTGPRLLGQPAPDRADLCAAAQQVREVRDPDGAAAFLRQWGARDGETVCFTGVAGGYSIVSARVHGHEVGLLTGSIPANGVPAGLRLLEDFAGRHPWIGGVVFGGARAISLRRPWELVGRGPTALLGDAAGQMFSAHGSGIAMELVAARLLADALAEGRGCWGYNVAFQRRYGGRLAASDLFRRLSAGLEADDVRAMIRAGVLSPPLMADTMAQKPVRPPAGALLRAGAGMARLPGLARRLVPTLARMRALEAFYARYPEDPSRLPSFARRVGRLSGVPAWIG